MADVEVNSCTSPAVNEAVEAPAVKVDNTTVASVDGPGKTKECETATKTTIENEDDLNTNTINNEAPGEKRKRDASPDEDDWKARRTKFQSDRESGERRGDHNNQNRRGGFRGGRGGGGSGFNGEYKNYKTNIKSTYEKPETDDPDEIRKQVEFYFSDSNLFTDRFLLEQIEGSKNKPVPIKVIHSFKRMRCFQPYSAIVEALKASEILDVTENEEVVRKNPLPENVEIVDIDANLNIIEDARRSRSIYVKGFGAEKPRTQLDIEAFFEPYGPINSVRLRRTYPDRLFKGSVFVEFDSDETAKQFLESEAKPKWEGKELQFMSKEKYVLEKARDVHHERIDSNGWRGSPKGSRGGYQGRGGNNNNSRGGKFNRGRNNSRGGGRGRGGNESRRRSRSTSAREKEGKTEMAGEAFNNVTVDVAAEAKTETETREEAPAENKTEAHMETKTGA